MTDEAKALVERDTVCAGDKPYTNGIRDLAEMPHVSEQLGNVFRDCANIIDARNDLIETQAREIERLREALAIIRRETTSVIPEMMNQQMCIDAVNAHARAALGANHDQ